MKTYVINDPKNINISNGFIWPEMFETGIVPTDRPEILLCADALCAWAAIVMGSKKPDKFGTVMAEIAIKLGVDGTPESFMELSKSLRKKLK